MKTTIKDIAEACGVSKATVSRYLNSSGYVSKDVADRIKNKIEELNYIPSATARNLSLQESNVIGVVIPEVSNPFFGEVYKGISDIADDKGISIFYCDTNNDADKELFVLNTLRSHNISGLILTPATGGLLNQQKNEAFVEAVENLNVPVVLLDRDVEYVNWNGVFTDNFKGAYDATNELLKAGHTKVATISGDQRLHIGKERMMGYKKAIQDAGMKLEQKYIKVGDFSTKKGYQMMKELLNMSTPPTAVFSPNNLTTMGVLKAIREEGLTIPEDMAVVGFDDIELLDVLGIKLTAMKRDTVDMGREAMSLLLRLMNNDSDSVNDSQRIIIDPELVLRGSEIKA